MKHGQSDLFRWSAERFRPIVARFLVAQLNTVGRPAARELLLGIEKQICLDASWVFKDAIADCTRDPTLASADRQYFAAMLNGGSIDEALLGNGAAEEETVSTIDALLRQSAVYRSPTAFREMISFMGRFKNYSPYNNVLVRLQNPSCGFFATERDWREKHGRHLIEDARPMLSSRRCIQCCWSTSSTRLTVGRCHKNCLNSPGLKENGRRAGFEMWSRMQSVTA